jgi:hypothetical protein
MDAVFIALLLVTFANFALAGFVLWHDPHAEVNRVFALTALSTAVWTLTNAVFRATDSLSVALLAAQISYLSAITLGASILHFSWTFPLHRPVPRSWKNALWITAAVIGMIPFVPGLIIQSVDLSSLRSIATAPGVYVLAAFMLGSIGWAFGNFLGRHASLRRVAREQSRYVMVGLALATLSGLICNLLLPLSGDYRLVWLGPAASLFFVAFTVHAVIAHHLFDIRFIIKKTLVYSILIAAVGAGYSVAEHSLTEFLKGVTANSHFAWLANIGGALLIAILFAPFKKWIEKQVSRIIYRDRRHTAAD